MTSKQHNINKQIKPFRSFEEMENEQLIYYASLSPVELLQNHKQLSMSAYGLKSEPFLKSSQRIIKFGKPE